MRIGDLHIEVPVLLAPLAAVTDLPFRSVCEELGAGLTITEFVDADALVHGDELALGKLTPSLDGRSFGAQIYGRQESELARAASMAVDVGASLVDINMGCPKKSVVAGVCGAALMRETELAAALVKAAVRAVPDHIPITVKHRAGWDDDSRNAPAFASQMVSAGAQMITVHGRTRAQGFAGICDLEVIARVRDAVPHAIPVIGNGDVREVEDYQRMRMETGCDGVMIGRGAWGNPWLFRRLRAVEQGLGDPGPPTLEERVQTFERHVALIWETASESKRLHEVRKAVAWYAKGLSGCNDLRKAAWKEPEPVMVHEMAMSFFRQCGARHSGAA